MPDIKKVSMEEFSSKLGGSLVDGDNFSEGFFSFFLLGEKSGVVRNDILGTVEFINLPEEELSSNEELKLLINICGKPGEFSDKIKIPSFKTIIDYQEEARHVDRFSLLTWVAEIAFILIPITLTIWLIALIPR